jgi:hypothetical protein
MACDLTIQIDIGKAGVAGSFGPQLAAASPSFATISPVDRPNSRAK